MILRARRSPISSALVSASTDSSTRRLPAGRKPVTTAALSNQRRAEIVQRVATACAEGRQAYWVCTLVEESEAIEAQAAEAGFQPGTLFSTSGALRNSLRLCFAHYNEEDIFEGIARLRPLFD